MLRLTYGLEKKVVEIYFVQLIYTTSTFRKKANGIYQVSAPRLYSPTTTIANFLISLEASIKGPNGPNEILRKVARTILYCNR